MHAVSSHPLILQSIFANVYQTQAYTVTMSLWKVHISLLDMTVSSSNRISVSTEPFLSHISNLKIALIFLTSSYLPLALSCPCNISRPRRTVRTTIMYTLHLPIFHLQSPLHLEIKLSLFLKALLIHVSKDASVHCLGTKRTLENLHGR